MLFSFFFHFFHLFLRKIGGIFDSNLLLLASSFVGSLNIQNTIRINVEGNLNLGDTSRCRWNTIKNKSSKSFVISRHRSLTLENVNLNLGLVIGSSGEDLGLGGRDGGIALN